MATYKVLQDIEAEDKLVGPLTLWQFIYALIAGLCIYLSAIAVMKNVPFFLIILAPAGLFVGFLAIPWGGDQPTEVWALAKLRFFLKPRLRIWDQTGMTELVTVTAPKHEEQRPLTDGLSQGEVKSRLRALANTLDSRGWAVKNVNVNLATALSDYSASDRLVDVSTTPQEVASVDIRPDDDILDEQANPVAQTFSTMINQAANLYHKTLIDRMNQPLPQTPNIAGGGTELPTVNQPQALPDKPPVATTVPIPSPPATAASQQQPTDYWFMQPPAAAGSALAPASSTTDWGMQQSSTILQAADSDANDEAVLRRSKLEEDRHNAAYGHMKKLKTPKDLAEETQQNASTSDDTTTAPAVTPEKQAAIMNLSRSNDLNIDTLARQAKEALSDDSEVVISLR